MASGKTLQVGEKGYVKLETRGLAPITQVYCSCWVMEIEGKKIPCTTEVLKKP